MSGVTEERDNGNIQQEQIKERDERCGGKERKIKVEKQRKYHNEVLIIQRVEETQRIQSKVCLTTK